MGCRKNQASLTAAEKAAFVNAILTLKNSVPSQMGLASRYDDYVQVHMNSMMASPGWAHQRPAFLPWHRQFLRQFELDLQKIDPTVTIPYWDWTVDQNPAAAGTPFTNDFMGGDGDAGDDAKVKTGPFAENAGQWTLNVISGDPGDTASYLRREFGVNANTLPSPAQQTTVLNETAYDVANWNISSPSGFRNHLEGWLSTGAGAVNAPPQMHNRVHVWVGGTMLPMTSPNDPTFWLNHCNIDRLWAVWQAQHPASAPYLPVSGAATGHNLNDNMIFSSGGPAPWAEVMTPAGAIDHHALGYWYETDPPNVVLLTPSVSFVDIQEGIGGTGITTYRPIKVESQSCSDVLLEIIAGPTAGFGAPSNSETVEPNHQPTMGLSPSQGAIWVSYTSQTPGSSITGSVTVQATDVESGTVFGPWVINLSANTVAREASAVALVLDRSGSMSTDAGNGHSRVELLRTAAQTFVDLMQQGDGLSMVRFDDQVDTLMPVTDVGAMPGGAGRVQAHDIITTSDPSKTLDPRGATSIGGGIAAGKAALDAAAGTFARRAMIVLTDGLENTPPMIADVASSLNDHTFAIGFGQAAAISTSALNAITQNHGGYLVVTGPITPEENFALTEYFLKIQAGINNSTAVLDPRGELVYGQTHRIPFWLTRADHGVDVVLLSPAPYYIDFELETPDGKIIDPGVAGVEPAVSYVGTSRVSYYRASLPMLMGDPAGSHSGQWHVLLRLGLKGRDADRRMLASVNRPSLPYSLLVHSYSDLTFRPSLVQKSFEPGARFDLRIALDQYEVPLDTGVTAWAEITAPDKTQSKLILTKVGPGRFEGSFTAALPGIYTANLRARGRTFEGQPFQREQRFTAVTFVGGDNPAPRPPEEDPMCHLIKCLVGEKVLNPDILKLLESRGINLKALLECVESHCGGSEVYLGGERPASALGPAHAVFDPSGFLRRDELAKALATIAEQEPAVLRGFDELVQAEPIVKPDPGKMVVNFGIDLRNRPSRPRPQRGHHEA